MATSDGPEPVLAACATDNRHRWSRGIRAGVQRAGEHDAGRDRGLPSARRRDGVTASARRDADRRTLTSRETRVPSPVARPAVALAQPTGFERREPRRVGFGLR
jgi:hypothetical protein